jgi:hypothetical protein
MSSEATFTMIAAAVISLLVEWSPRISLWWHALSETKKKQLMAAAIMILSIGSVGVKCAYYKSCPADPLARVGNIVLIFLLSAGAQQGLHRLTKRSKESVARLLARR